MESVAITTDTFEQRKEVIEHYQSIGYKRWPYSAMADFELCVFVIHEVKGLMIRTNRTAEENSIDNGYKILTYNEWKSTL